MHATYSSLVRDMCRRFGVPELVVHSFLKEAGASRPSEVTGEVCRQVTAAMEAEEKRLNDTFADYGWWPRP